MAGFGVLTKACDAASNDGFVLAKSTHHFDGDDKKFQHKDANGFTIRWSLEGPIPPTASGS